MSTRLYSLIPVIVLAAGCGTTATQLGAESPPDVEFIDNPRFAQIGKAETKEEKDRLAILAMQGGYQVGFHFQETVPLKAGYEHRDEKNSGAYEVVMVIEETPEKIALQHVLVMPGGYVIKHWRQDWTYEAKERFEFAADQTWDVRPLEAERTSGTWTQCVFEVSDAPRYCGTGKWNHRYGVSTWTSDRSWRPLPRREYTTRDDYNALNVENRHTVTPQGWTHEQDNTKTVRDGRSTVETLVREFGFNNYRNIEGYDFSPAENYWDKTHEYWAEVRAAWERRLSTGSTLVLNTGVDGMDIITATFEQAENADETSAAEEKQAIEALLSEYTENRALMSGAVNN